MAEALKVFRLAFSTILFCIGVALLVNTSILYADTLCNVRSKYQDKEIYQKYNADDPEKVSYTELIATLCSKPEYDTVINKITINKSTFEPENIKYYDIPVINYKKSYVYDNNGNIAAIKYNGITD